MKIKMVSDWRAVCKEISTWCMSVYLAGLGVFNELPTFIQSAFTSRTLKVLGAALIAFGLIGKFVDQGIRRDGTNP
jgi:hypothetical protein